MKDKRGSELLELLFLLSENSVDIHRVYAGSPAQPGDAAGDRCLIRIGVTSPIHALCH